MRRLLPGSSKPGAPIHIGQGYRPHVLVDDAGAAHITWSTGSVQHGPAGEHTYTAGWDNYCRLSRGARSCGDPARFDAPITYPAGPGDTSPFFMNSPGGNQDIGEGSLALATGRELLILAHRPGNVVAVPGGRAPTSTSSGVRTTAGRRSPAPGSPRRWTTTAAPSSMANRSRSASSGPRAL